MGWESCSALALMIGCWVLPLVIATIVVGEYVRREGFPPVYGEVLFLDMRPADGAYEPLLGYIVLEQCQAAVDMPGLRLVHVKKSDLK